MITRIAAAAAAALLTASAAAVAVATPAAAAAAATGPFGGTDGVTGTGSASSGCQGRWCHISVSYSYAGSSGSESAPAPSGGTYVPAPPPPPPACQWLKLGNQVAGSKDIVSQYGSLTGTFPQQAAVKQAEGMLEPGANPPSGTWYRLQINGTGTAAQNAACNKLPPLAFALAGEQPPATPFSFTTFIDYVLKDFPLPYPVLTMNPDASAYVNLGTYVWWGAPEIGSPASVPQTVAITATAGPETGTVVAKLKSAKIKATPDGTVYNNCNPLSGSAQSPQSATLPGPGVAPDCGVLWTTPDPNAGITVALTWAVRFHTGTSTAFQPGTVVPGAQGGIEVDGSSGPLAVQDIESVNGSGS